MAGPAEDDLLEQLISMDDIGLRRDMGTVLQQSMRAGVDVRSTFFPNAPAPDYSSPGLDNLGNRSAIVLICMALAHTADYGFARTVNGAAADAELRTLLGGNPAFQYIGLDIYMALFPDRVRSGSFRFADALAQWDYFYKAYCEAIASDAFFVKAMARRAADPRGFTQYVHLQVYKAKALSRGSDPSPLSPVLDRWKYYMSAAPWNVYEFMQYDRFSEQTFMPEVKARVGEQTKTVSWMMFCQGLGQCRAFPTTKYTYGIAVQSWLDQTRDKYPILFTGQGPDNRR
jgi:hypothetical protein